MDPWMQSFLYYLATFLVFAVIVVLAMGLWTLLKGRSPSLSQQLMRWRIAIQFMAIAVIIAYVFVKHLGS
jgi:Hypoxia induced protein conserved region